MNTRHSRILPPILLLFCSYSSVFFFVTDIEALLVQIKAEIVGGNARVSLSVHLSFSFISPSLLCASQIDFSNPTHYSLSEAQEAFARVARDHHWQ